MFPGRNILPERRLRTAKCARAGTSSGPSDMPVSAFGTVAPHLPRDIFLSAPPCGGGQIL
jgi:hypothetical protein